MFDEVGLRRKADDETVWRFCQEHGYLLLTGNRSRKDGKISLELTIRRLVNSESLPVITIGNLGRVLARPEYCKQCAEQSGCARLYLIWKICEVSLVCTYLVELD